jgi:flavin-dependent dehydrogenase
VRGVEIRETVSLWGSSNPVTWSAMCNPYGAGLAITRSSFDEVLLEAAGKAGATVMRDAWARRADGRPGSWDVEVSRSGDVGSIQADFLVLASGGRGSGLVRRVNGNRAAQLALTASVGASEVAARHALYLERVDSSRWAYALPDVRGGFFVGICSDRRSPNRVDQRAAGAFRMEFARTRLLSAILPGPGVHASVVTCPAGPRRYDVVIGRRWLAVGDSAFMSNPLSGMGIDFAVESARMGAQAIRSARPEALAEYELAVRRYSQWHERVSDIFASGSPALEAT